MEPSLVMITMNDLYTLHCNNTVSIVTPGGGTQYKSGYRDVPQTWVAKSGCQVHQWVLFLKP